MWRSAANGSETNDLAIVQLSSNVTGVTPAPILNPASTVPVLGQTGYLVGFGYGGTGTTGYSFNTTTGKRAATNALDAYGLIAGNSVSYPVNSATGNAILSDFDAPPDDTTAGVANQLGSATPTSLEGTLAPHDSGGGLFVQNGSTSNYYLVGINESNSSDGRLRHDQRRHPARPVLRLHRSKRPRTRKRTA